MDLKTKIENKIKHYLPGRDEISFAYLFGSFISTGRYNDIDIAVYLNHKFGFNDPNKYPFGYEAQLIGKLNLILNTDKIDLMILNKANLLAATQVYNSGKLLFERDRFFRIRIENAVRKEYIDTEIYRKIKAKQLKNYLNVR